MKELTFQTSLLVVVLLLLLLVGRSLALGIGELTFISSNRLKIKEVRALLSDLDIEVHVENLELWEPQATPVEISRKKCEQAVKLVAGPVIVEDTSLCFNALNGMPGPYVKWFYESLGSVGLARLLDGFDDRSAYAQCVLSFSEGFGSEVKSFVGVAEGSILRPSDVASRADSQGFGWDPIFLPVGFDKPFGAMSMELKNQHSARYKAFKQFKQYLSSRTEG